MSGQSKPDGSYDEDEDEGEEDVEVEAEQEEDEDEAEGEDDTPPAQGQRKGKAPAQAHAQARKPRFPNKRNTQSVGRRKIKIDYIQDKARRHVTFTKRKSGLMKKAYELSTLTGTDCFVLVVSESGAVYTFSTTALSGITDHPRGKEVLEAVLRGELRGDDAEEAPVASGSGSNTQHATYDPHPTSAAGAPAEHHNHSHDHLHDIMLPHFELDPVLSGLDLPVPPMMGDSSSHFPSSSSALHPLFSDFDLGGHSSSDYLHLPSTTTASASSAPLPLPPLDFTQPFASTTSSASLFSATTATAPPPTAAAASPPTSASSTLTPYELARLSHAAAFASYQAAVPYDRAPSYVLSNAYPGRSVRDALKPLEKGEDRPAVEKALEALRGRESPGVEGSEGKKGADSLKRKHGVSDFGEEAWALVKKVKERASTSGGVGSLGIQSGLFATSPAGPAGGSRSSPGESIIGLEAIRWAAKSTTNSPAGAFGASSSPAAVGGAVGTPRTGVEGEVAGEEVSRGEGVQARKARWKLAVAEVLQEARRTLSVSTILRAHCYSLYATSPLPPSYDPSAPLYSLSEGLHWASFARMCEKAGVEDVTREFSDRVPASFLPSALAASRAIFLPFTDFLEAHALAPDSVCMRLVSPVPATDERGGFGEGRKSELYASEEAVGGGEAEAREGVQGGGDAEGGA
ncbi:transcription factor of the MADS box [Rhodotorula toruloides]